jgi:cation diffusion facilitator CzcD-associated flavoprotein CzcO
MTGTAEGVRVAVIGSGMSGLFMAKRCIDMGLPYTIYEKAGEVGGTWRDNRYPGLYVDIPSADYQLPFFPKYDWERSFASGPELGRYLVDLADALGIREHIRFHTEIVSARWLGDVWELTAASGQTFEAEVVVAATGFLHRPRIPAIDGLTDFAGPSFHSSAWPDGLDVTGKRVGIIGNGSSGIQILSALAYLDCEVTQFIRTPQWIEICENPFAPEDERRVARADPEQGKQIVATMRDRIGQDVRLTNPAWKLAPGPLRDGASAALREDLEIIRDPELRAALTPDYDPGCKRIPKSVHYFDAVQRDNVHIVRGRVAAVTPNAVVMDSGRSYEVDILVLATGFDAHAYMRPMSVLGVDGQPLDAAWRDGPYSYRGISVPGFPNFYLLHGPFSPVNNVNVPWTLQQETDYICALLEQVRTTRVSHAPTVAATERFIKLVQTALPPTVWAGDCDNWYKAGGNAIVWPWLEKEHREMFEHVELSDLVIARLERTVPAGTASARESPVGTGVG